MTVLIFVGFIILVGFGLLCLRMFGDFWEGVGIILMIVGVLGLFGFSLALPIHYYSIVGEIEKYNEVRLTIEKARMENPEIIERAAILQTIAEWNGWLASMRYWNGTIFDWYVPDAVNTLQPIN